MFRLYLLKSCAFQSRYKYKDRSYYTKEKKKIGKKQQNSSGRKLLIVSSQHKRKPGWWDFSSLSEELWRAESSFKIFIQIIYSNSSSHYHFVSSMHNIFIRNLGFICLCFCCCLVGRSCLNCLCAHMYKLAHTHSHKSSSQLPTLHLPISVGENAKRPGGAVHKHWRNPQPCRLCASLYWSVAPQPTRRACPKAKSNAEDKRKGNAVQTGRRERFEPPSPW